MVRYRRPRRRQGVVYGPPRAHEGSESSMVGRVLGPIFVVGAFGLLAAGAWAFVGRGGAAPAATPTGAAIVSPSPSASPSISPTPTLPAGPTASASPPPTLPPSPSPSPLAIEVREGPGAITFGTQFDERTLRVTDPQTTFPARGRFVWSAQLTEAASAPQLTVRVSAYDPATGTETMVHEEISQVRNQRASIFLRRPAMQRIADGPGVYVVRYFRDDLLLAEGFLRVE